MSAPLSSISQNSAQTFASRRSWPVWVWLVGPLLLRLILLPLSHLWDTQTWYSMFADFKFGRSPYATLQNLSYEARAEHLAPYYEYYAYPPGLIYLYWPSARLYALLDNGLNYSLAAAYSLAAPTTTWYFSYFFKLPIVAADIGIVFLLSKMGGRVTALRYAWNPYVLLVVIWTFDPLMVFCLLWAVYALERHRSNQAALALALGTILKYVPLFIVPAVLLYLFRQKYTFFQLVRFALVYVGVCVVLIIPFAQGNAFAFEFQTNRGADGLTWQHFFIFLADWGVISPYQLTIITATVGALVLPVGLLLVYAYTYRRNLTLYSTLLVTLLGYLALTKIVNEVYALAVVPFILLELKNHPTPRKERYFKLLWSIPLAWQLIFPIFYFLINPLANLNQLDYTNVANLADLFDFRTKALLLAVIGIGYSWLCLKAIPLFAVKENYEH